VKYCVVIIDGAAGLPLAERGGKTSLELARTPNLDALASGGVVGLARTVPPGMEPSSACACMSVLGYDPNVYYRGRSAIEARSLGIPIERGEVVFRCNLVTLRGGRMWDYSAGHITSGESRELVSALNEKLGSDKIYFYPGVSYRHILKIKGGEAALGATCTPPHDIPGKPVADFLPRGSGSGLLRDLMQRSEIVLREHPVNRRRVAEGKAPATTIWLFWGSGQVPQMPSFRVAYGLDVAITSGVDLLRGLGLMAAMDILEIPGVTDGLDNNAAAQMAGAMAALARHDLVVVHIEAPDEAAHSGLADEKVAAIERIDREALGGLRAYKGDSLRALIMPDHPTPLAIRTHTPEPVPFLLWGQGFQSNRALRLSEAEAVKTGLYLDPGYIIMSRLVGG
jgi:2,3-bisphosphoglycerate-independent phosphoglycerate mutase